MTSVNAEVLKLQSWWATDEPGFLSRTGFLEEDGILGEGDINLVGQKTRLVP